jgi:phosphate transport system substrate-binding protein
MNVVNGRPRHSVRRTFARAAATVVAVGGVLLPALLAVGAAPAGAAGYVPIYGEGSSWSANAIDQWASDVQADGMRINYTSNGSTTGRQDFVNGLTDFAASDIPFQTNPTDGSAPEHPQAGSYAYMPITAGGTVFMYNLEIDGSRVTNLRLSGENITKIFTGAITNWDDPALAADNPDLKLPNLPIVPVVRSDGAGDSYELTEWMINQYPSLWNSYCAAAGRAPACGATSFYPTSGAMIAQSGDLGVAGYVSSSYANGSIGYVNYSYALEDHFPVAQLLNAAGYYTEPTPQNVAVSLLAAQVDTTDVNNPALYLTENLTGVYTDQDPRTYPLSSYSYFILPTTVQGQFNTSKGTTLAAFSYFAMCQGQQQSAALGYSPMPINLVEASFDQIKKIPGAVVQNINIQSCNNPTFTPTGTNLLATTAPNPPACDKQGTTQCTTGTGGDTAATAATVTPASSSHGAAASTATTTPGSAAARPTASPGAATGSSASGAAGGATTTGLASGSTGSTGASVDPSTGTAAACDPTTTTCATAPASGAGTDPAAVTAILPAGTGWSATQTVLVLIALLFLALLLLPGILMVRLRKREP